MPAVTNVYAVAEDGEGGRSDSGDGGGGDGDGGGGGDGDGGGGRPRPGGGAEDGDGGTEVPQAPGTEPWQPFWYASQRLPYVIPSSPHTGLYSVVQNRGGLQPVGAGGESDLGGAGAGGGGDGDGGDDIEVEGGEDGATKVTTLLTRTVQEYGLFAPEYTSHIWIVSPG